ncbi:MAG: phage major capsid protein [Gammaproteobacteria bacterium]|nr:phage major capsid protein [Gammaproteobacteria bacterium]
MLDISPLSNLVTTERADSGDIKIPVNARGTGTAWSSETGTRSSQNTPTVHTVSPTYGGLYSVVSATQWIVSDSFLNLEQFLINEIAAESAVALEAAIVDGDGTDKPTGFLQATTTTTDDATRTFGELQYVASGNATAIPHNPATPVHGGDVLLDVVDALRVPYRRSASWVMNRSTRTTIAKWKDADERHILTPGMGGSPDTLFLGQSTFLYKRHGTV